MPHEVYANGMEIAAKAGMGKVIAAFPDVCLSPPSPPAGPLPVPYPDTSFSSDLKEGSDTVKLGGKPAALAQQSYYQPSALGDEAATKTFGMAVVTHQITGKTYFQAWSMDVLIEGKNACRHLDITTSNHASYPGSTPPFPNAEAMIQLALDRIALKQCPCCGRDITGCPAAFQEGDQAQSMEEHYGLEAKEADGSPTQEALRRKDAYRQTIAMKETECTCEGRVFPEAPCDVFRAPDPGRTAAIVAQWDAQAPDYRANYPGGPVSGTINHLTPKSAGGCPDNPGNLQPAESLCKVCSAIDSLYTRWQGREPGWLDAWKRAFRESGAKRFRLGKLPLAHW
jgi:hypothetical protein